MFNSSITTSISGLFLGPTLTLEIVSWMSNPITNSPNTVCLLFKFGIGISVIKNWLPFVAGPELAIDKIPGLSCFSVSSNSSPNL